MNLTKPAQPFTEPRNSKSEARIKVEQVIADYTPKGGISIVRIAEIADLDASTVRKVVAHLRDAKKVVNISLQKSPLYVNYTEEVKPTTAQPARHVPRGNYDPIELRPYDGRPGAMDAYSKPSLRDGVLVPYNGIRPMLVGSLKDGSNNAR